MTYPGPSTYPGAAASTTPGGSTGGGSTPGTPVPVQTTWSSPGGEISVGFNYTTWPPRAELAINWPGATTVTVTRQDPAEAWPVRYAEPATLDASGKWTGYDYELLPGVASSYTIKSAQKATTVSVTTGIFNVPAQWQTALIHPQAPSLSVPIRLYEGTGATVVRSSRQASLAVLGRARPVVITDVRSSPSTQLVIWCETAAEADALDTILADGSALRLVCDPRLGWNVNPAYIAVGDASSARALPALATLPDRFVTLPYVEVDRPAGSLVGTTGSSGGTGGTGTGSGFWTYAAAEAAYSTYAAAEAAFATYADAELDKVR